MRTLQGGHATDRESRPDRQSPAPTESQGHNETLTSVLQVVDAIGTTVVQPLARAVESENAARASVSRDELEFADRQLARKHHLDLSKVLIGGLGFLSIVGIACYLCIIGQVAYGLMVLGYIVIGTGGYGVGRVHQHRVDEARDEDGD